MKDKKCALYIRVSTPRQASVEDGSLDAQESKLKAYVNYENTSKQDKWKISGTYREEGRSAKDLKRPQFQRMMQDINDGKINTIVVWKIDRLTRSLKDFSNLWETFKDQGIQLISLNEKFDTSTAIGRAMLTIILVFAQLEREQTGERTSATMQYRAEQGLWNGGRILGYDLDKEKKGVLKINKEQSKLINKAFELCMQKGSAGQTQQILNELGHRMPTYESRRGKKHGNTLFTKQAVIRLLTNSAYIGKISWAGKLYKGIQKPIIDAKTFDKVQTILGKNRKTRTNERAPKQHVYILQGILKCGKCGSMLTPKSGKNGSGQPYHYYQCTQNSHIGKQACKAKYVPAKSIEDFVLERVRELSTKQEEIDAMIERASKAGNKQITQLEENKKRLLAKLQEVKGRLGKIVDAIEAGQAFRTFSERVKTLEEERESLEKKIEETSFEIEKASQEILSAETMKQNFQQLRDVIDKANPQQLKDLLYNIIEVIEYHESTDDKSTGHLKISYFEQPNLTIPDPKNTKSEQHPNGALFAQSIKWLPREDSNLGHGGYK
ncbi:MAG: recombinase family protein [Candidatus Omnitrophica bacterium]|nr:recombinase family protein [Candidatus Omnitrophota bacterium]